MAGYVRQDVTNEIEDGNPINAGPLDGEYNALATAFSSSSGHRHNGAVGEGAPITVVGPSQNVSISSNSVTPSVDDSVSLGSSTLEFKDLWIDGTANIDSLVADVATVGGSPVVTGSSTQTLTNKTINLTDNTLIATSAQMAAAITDETGTDKVVFSDSPALTGTPTAPTASAGTNTTQIATTAHVNASILDERSQAATLTNKTLTSPVINTPTVNSAVITTSNITITGGTITGISDLAIADGGTGASDAATARSNLGVAIGTDVQAYDAGLQSIAGLTTVADRMLYTTGADTYAVTPVTTFGRSMLGAEDGSDILATLSLGTMSEQDADDVLISGGSITGIADLAVADGGTGASNATDARLNLGLGSMATQDSGGVNITGGSIASITDIAVADGGTGASTASGARTNLGLAIGTDVQAYSAALTTMAGSAGLVSIAALGTAADRMLYTTGANTFAEATITGFARNILDDADAATARGTLGLGTLATVSPTGTADGTTRLAGDGTWKPDLATDIAAGAVGAPRIEDAALDSTVTSAGETWVAARMIARAAQGIGTYILAETVGALGAQTPGSTVAGSSLRHSNATGAGNGGLANMSGTWRCMGRTSSRTGTGQDADAITLWQRIA